MQPTFLLLNLGTPELIVIAMVGLLLFGRRLPDVGRSLGKSFLEFKAGLNDMKSELSNVERLVDEHSERPAAQEPIDVDATKNEDPEAVPRDGDAPKSS